MHRDTIIIAVCVVLIFLSGLVLVWAGKLADSDFSCQTDIVTNINNHGNDPIELNLTAILIFKYPSTLNIFYKGTVDTKKDSFIMDRVFNIALRKIENSRIYKIDKKEIVPFADDTAPQNIINKFQLDGIDFFNFFPAGNHAWIIQGFALPIMVCSSL